MDPGATRRGLLRSASAALGIGLTGCTGYVGSSGPDVRPDSRVSWWTEPETGAEDAVLDGDRLYVGGYGGAVCFDRTDGERLWQWQVDGDVDPSCDGGGTLARVGDSLLVYTCGTLRTLDASTGEVRATLSIRPRTAPVTDDETLYLAGRDGLEALRLADGDTVWSQSVATDFRRPTVAAGYVLLGHENGVTALDATDGAVRWTRETEHDGQVPAVADGTVYVGTRGEDETGRLLALSLADGSVEWDVPAGGASRGAPPAVTDETVYLGNWHGLLRAHARSDGRERWTFEADDWLVSQPTVVDGVAYVGSNDERVYAVNATDGTTRWEFVCDDAASGRPVVGSDAVFETTTRYLFALERE